MQTVDVVEYFSAVLLTAGTNESSDEARGRVRLVSNGLRHQPCGSAVTDSSLAARTTTVAAPV